MLSRDGVINLNDLKKKKPAELAKYAAELQIEGAAGMRKQDLIFALLQAHSENDGAVFAEGVSRFCPMASAFCGRRTTTIWPAPTTSTSRRRRFAA
jgi:transcription termination factor Rho